MFLLLYLKWYLINQFGSQITQVAQVSKSGRNGATQTIVIEISTGRNQENW